MTGAEHYAEAERLAFEGIDGDSHFADERERMIAAAQVHATLALAAASASARPLAFGEERAS
jgi:hypothetical protein